MEAGVRRDIKLTGLAVAQLTAQFVPADTGQARDGLALSREDFMA
jgi:hypothetical protein